MADNFMSLKECCLDRSFSRPLRDKTSSAADLLPGGRHHLLLRAAFQGLPHNIAVENSFARLKSMQKSGRGRSDISEVLCSKHLIAEVKKAHLEHVKFLHSVQLEENNNTQQEEKEGLVCSYLCCCLLFLFDVVVVVVEVKLRLMIDCVLYVIYKSMKKGFFGFKFQCTLQRNCSTKYMY